MEILTTRFGPVAVAMQDRVDFPRGLVGIPQLKRFVLIPDPQLASLLWLQSAREPSWALAMIEPRRVVPTYQVRTAPEQLKSLQIADPGEIEVWVALNRTTQSFTANLQAPILINRRRSVGLQLVLSDTRYLVRYEIDCLPSLRKCA